MSAIFRLLKLVLPYKKWIALSVFLGLLTIASSIGLMMTSAFVISMAALHPSIAEIQVAIVGVRFFGISRGIFRYLERLISHNTTFRLLSHFRVRFYAALEPLVPARVAHLKSGDLLQRIVADIQNLENFFVRVIAPPSVSVLTALLMTLILWAYHINFALAFITFYALAGTIIPYLSVQLSRGMGKQITVLKNQLNVALLDHLNGLPELLINRQIENQEEKIKVLNKKLSRLQRNMLIIDALHQGFVTLLMFGAVVMVLIVGIPMVENNMLNGVYLAVLVLGVMAAFEGVLPLPQMAQYLEENNEAGKRLFEIIDRPPQVVDPQQPIPFPNEQPVRFSINNLTFAYNNTKQPALKNLRLEIPYSSKVAIVGPSGSGKSTLARLLIRLYDYQSGQILLNERELKNYRQTDIRENIGYASQSFHLFTGSVADNLHLVNPEASERQMLNVLRLVNLSDLSHTPQETLNYWIGEHGNRLSGGQAQRLALAQVLLKNSPVLIFDEVTSSLDAETERLILKNIFDHFKKQTIINITHRLNNMEHYDMIFVLKEGELIGRGTHHDLMRENEHYRHLFKIFQESLLFA
ncbi:thiol reductant ABC exporter subunit CydC [Caldithrix abyssi]